MRLGIIQLTDHEKSAIRGAVAMCLRYWPNAHLGDTSPREDMREAFKRLRQYIMTGASVEGAVGTLECDALAHEDM